MRCVVSLPRRPPLVGRPGTNWRGPACRYGLRSTVVVRPSAIGRPDRWDTPAPRKRIRRIWRSGAPESGGPGSVTVAIDHQGGTSFAPIDHVWGRSYVLSEHLKERKHSSLSISCARWMSGVDTRHIGTPAPGEPSVRGRRQPASASSPCETASSAETR
jgi:hypothetical protein